MVGSSLPSKDKNKWFDWFVLGIGLSGEIPTSGVIPGGHLLHLIFAICHGQFCVRC